MVGDLWLVGHVWRSGSMFVVDATEDVLGVTRLYHVALTGFWGGFWGVILTFVVDATEDVLGVTRLHHVALTGFLGVFWVVILTFVVDATEDVLGVMRLHHVELTDFFFGGVLGCDIDVRCGCCRRCSWCHAFALSGTNRFFWGVFWGVILTCLGPWGRFAEDGMLKKKRKNNKLLFALKHDTTQDNLKNTVNTIPKAPSKLQNLGKNNVSFCR